MEFISILRQFKIGSFAVFDIVAAYLGVFLLAPFLTKLTLLAKVSVPRVSWMWFTLPLSVVFHLAVNQNTPFMKIILDNTKIGARLVLLAMLYMGCRQIRIVSKE